MRITIYGKNMEVSDYLKNTIDKKVSKLNKYFPDDTDVQVMLAVRKNQHVAEISIPLGNTILRAIDRTGDMYASLDGAVDKLDRQIRKYRTKLTRNLRESIAFHDTEPDDDYTGKVVKVKHFDMKPMSVDEAIMQLDLIGHEFYVFCNSETDMINVLYRRNDGDYGLIEPEN